MAKQLTKTDLDKALKQFGRQIDKRFDSANLKMQENTKDIIRHFNQSQSDQNERLAVIETKLDSIMDELATRRELRNLVGELKRQGVQIQEEKIFVT